MSFDFVSVENAGNLERERVVLKATSGDDIGDYAIFQAYRSAGDVGASGNVPRAYWFTNTKVEVGDFVVLYTKKGARSSKKSENGSTSYFFYWGLSTPIWDKSSKAALIAVRSYKYPGRE